MAIVYVDNRATGLGDGTTPENAYTSITTLVIGLGDTVEFIRGSGPYKEPLNLKRNGVAGSPIVWNFNGCEVTSKEDLGDSSKYKWTVSSIATNVYYLTTISGADTGFISGTTINNLNCITVDSRMYIASTGNQLPENQLVSPSTMLHNGHAARGDSDALGFNTLYVRSDSGNPNLHLSIFIATADKLLVANWRYHEINDIRMTYANIQLVEYYGRNWVFNNPIFEYSDQTGVYSRTAETVDNALVLNNPIFYWCGHRAIRNDRASNTVCTNPIIVGSHLTAMLDPTATGVLTISGGVSAYTSAGGIDNKSLNPALVNESNMFWHSLFNESQLGLAYLSISGWPTTDATDTPPNRLGNDATAMIPPAWKNYSIYGLNKCNFDAGGSGSNSGLFLEIAPSINIPI